MNKSIYAINYTCIYEQVPIFVSCLPIRLSTDTKEFQIGHKHISPSSPPRNEVIALLLMVGQREIL